MTADTPALSRTRWGICGLLLLATTLNYMDRVALNQLVNDIKDDLHFNDSQYSDLESCFAIAFGVGTLFAGWLVDRISVRWVYPAAVFLWSLAGFATGYVVELATIFGAPFVILLICRTSLGLFEAANWPCGIRTTRAVLSRDERSFGNALFQSGTAIGAILTPMLILLCLRWYGADTPGVWAIPFRAIGLIGLLWVAAWMIFVPKKTFAVELSRESQSSVPFWHIFRDHRFWVLVLVIIGTNHTWHTMRTWSPRFLREQHNYSKEDLQTFGLTYYIAADLGSWTVGLLTLWLTRRGNDLFRTRRATYLVCTLLLGVTAAIPFLPTGPLLTTALLIIGFAGLGLFPTYFALSQDLSARHQGKVTGTLGCINAIYLAGVYQLQGLYVEETKRFDLVIGIAAVPAVIASLALLGFWSAPEDAEKVGLTPHHNAD